MPCERAPADKGAWLHLAIYKSRPRDAAVVHLHSTYAVALSCRTDRHVEDAVPALTPYMVMRVGRVALVPYGRPGDGVLGDVMSRLAAHLQSPHYRVFDVETRSSVAEKIVERSERAEPA